MDLENNQILDVQVVQSNEVKSSYWMELEGLKRCFKTITDQGIHISDLVTDRHPQVKAYIRDERKEINHLFDVWHVAKGIYKKLEAVGKKRKCAIVGDWARSMRNHLYWCAASSNGDGEELLEKWLSVLNHITDVHEGHGEVFTACLRGPIEDRAWMKKDSLPYIIMEKIFRARLLMTDIKKLSPAEQTSSLESFQKLYIAALHFNENSARSQAVNHDGEKIYAISYPKSRKGTGEPKEVKVKQTYDYVTELLEEVIHQRQENQTYSDVKDGLLKLERNTPRAVCEMYKKEEKGKIVPDNITRFKKIVIFFFFCD